MRLTTITAVSTFAAVALLLSGSLSAQSGAQFAAPALSAPSISAPQISAPALTGAGGSATRAIAGAANQAFGNPVVEQPGVQAGSVLTGGSPAALPPLSYSGPVSYGTSYGGSYGNVSPSSASYGPLTLGDYPQGGNCCDLSPTQPGYCRKGVTSCCGKIGCLGIPPLLTPIRNDTPPIGAAVGRPLFRAWQGF